MAIIEVDDTDFSETIEAAFEKGQSVVLKFGSPLCDGCMVQEFEIEELDELVDNVVILDIDLSTAESLAYEFNITEVPTTIIYKDRDTMLLHKTGIILAADMQKILEEG